MVKQTLDSNCKLTYKCEEQKKVFTNCDYSVSLSARANTEVKKCYIHDNTLHGAKYTKGINSHFVEQYLLRSTADLKDSREKSLS